MKITTNNLVNQYLSIGDILLVKHYLDNNNADFSFNEDGSVIT
jgi:hypothetical protein